MDFITTPAKIAELEESNVIQTVAVYMDSRPNVPIVHLTQYDQTIPIVAVNAFYNDQPYTFPLNSAVNVRMEKPDGKHVYNPSFGVSSDRLTAYIAITAQMTAAAGLGKSILEVVLNGGVAASAPIKFCIDENPVTSADYESSDEYKTFYDLIKDAEASATAAEKSAETATDKAAAASTSASQAETSATNASNSAKTATDKASAASTSAANAATSASEAASSASDAADSASAAAASQKAAASSQTAAKTSETNAKTSADAAATSQSSAATSATSAAASQTAAETAAKNAKTSETAAKNSQTAAKQSEDNAAASAAAAAQSATDAAASANEVRDMANLSRSYAVGDTDTRPNEDADNAKYYYEQAKGISQGLAGSLLPMGTVAFAQLQNQTKQAGYMYNISDAFTTDSTFKEGAGHQYPAGTNVYYTADGKWDCLAGAQVVSVNGEAGAVTVKKLVSSTTGTYAGSSVTLSGDATNEWLDVMGVKGSDLFDRFHFVMRKTNGRPWMHLYKGGSTVGTEIGSQYFYTTAFPQPSVTGNAGTATKLATKHNINKVGFDGAEDISVPRVIATDLTGKTQNLDSLKLSAAGSTGVVEYYVCTTSTGAINITGQPVTGQPFALIVTSIRWASTADYITQQEFLSFDHRVYRRFCGGGTWGAWQQILDANGKSVTAVTADTAKACTGNADTATMLFAPVKINGVDFDGSKAITIYDNTKMPVSGNVLAATNFNTLTSTGYYIRQGNASNPLSNAPTNGDAHYHVLVLRFSDIYIRQVAYDVRSTAFWTRANVNNSWRAWERVYTTGYKPSAADVGALPTAGGTITGDLTVNGRTNCNSLTVTDAILKIGNGHIICTTNPPTGSQSMFFAASENNEYSQEENKYEVFLGVRSGMWCLCPNTLHNLRLGNPENRWDTVYSVTALNTSDKKEKEDIVALGANARDLIMGLEPVSFKWIKRGTVGTGRRTHMGLIAQDAQKVAMSTTGDLAFYQAACYDADGEAIPYTQDIPDTQKVWGINYAELIAPIIYVEQDHERRIRALEEKIV